jgi:hypothetical protein
MTQPTALEQEAAEIKKEIDQLRAAVAADPEDYLSKQRLTKVTDDYRLILAAVASAQKGTTAETAPGVNVPDGGRWEKVNGIWTQTVPPQVKPSNPDEDRSKAIKAQTDEADRNAKIRNERETGLYVDDKDLAAIRHAEATDQVAAARLKEDIRNNTARQKAEDDKLHLENQKFLQVDVPKATADIARLGAETGRIGAETDLTRAQIAALGIKTESDTARALAAGQLDKAQADKINAELKKPVELTGSADQQYLTRRDPTSGELLVEQNPNWQGPKTPTTRGELAQRVSLLQTQAQQMRDKIAADKSIPPDQQAARFNQWYDQNVAPQAGALEQQQQAIARDEAQKAMTAAATAISTTAPYRVGPNYGRAFEQIVQSTANTRFPGVNQPDIDLTGTASWKGPSIDQSVQQTLAPPPGMDINALLNRNQWAPGGGPVPGSATPAPAAAGPTPEQQAAIAAAGQQTAAASANPVNSPFGAIGNDPMLAAIQANNRRLASQQTAAATTQAAPPFGALNNMPRAGAMPMATGGGPLPYNPSAFSGVMPLLSGFDYSQLATQWQPPY